MPTFKKKYNTATAPPIDWLWASILERQRVYGLDLQEMANIAGVEYGTMRAMINRSPWDWKRSPRERVCQYFGITISVSPNADSRLQVRVG